MPARFQLLGQTGDKPVQEKYPAYNFLSLLPPFQYRGSEGGSLIASQSIRFSILMCSVEFCGESRLETAAGHFELGFSSRHVPQQRV
jgi:hypothetical protein